MRQATVISGLAVCLFASCCRPATASQYNSLLLFGDFLASTAVNNDPYSNGAFPPSPPFSDRRFCNGPVWTEYMNATGRISVRNYEVGGATSSNAVIQGATGLLGRYNGVVEVPSADEQVDAFIADPEAWADLDLNTTVFSISTINDLFYDPAASAGTTVAIWRAAMARFKAQVGARNFLLFDLYDVSQTPLALQANETLKQTYHSYSQDLTYALLELQDSWLQENPEDNVFYYSVQDTLRKLSFYGSPARYGYGELASYGRCLVDFYTSTNWTVCDNATEYVWWDEYHPTTRVHEILADEIAAVLST